MTGVISKFAPAKINLFLHIVGRRNDGLHDIQSIFVFASIGDRVSIAPSDQTRLSVSGPFAGAIEAAGAGNENNLVLKAARLLERRIGRSMPPVAIALEKNLPVASGIGGGSANAAAALRGLSGFWGIKIDGHDLTALALELGADVPACLTGRASWVGGVGEQVAPIDHFPETFAVLVNPRVEVSTANVFGAYAAGQSGFTDQVVPWPGGEAGALFEFLKTTRNDLEPIALRMAPAIADVLEELGRADKCILARMSGSGATCFGLFHDRQDAEAAAVRLSDDHPDWWIRSARLGSATNSGGQA